MTATIITITNQKGGVGKTTTVTHLAHGLAMAGKRVLIVDLDPQGQSAVALDVEQTPGVFGLLIAEQPPASLIVQARESLGILPGNKKTGAAQLAMSATDAIKERGWKGHLLGVLPTFYDTQTKESQAAIGELRTAFPKSLLSPIHRATVLRECAANGRTVFEMYPKSRAAQDYQILADFVLGRTT